MWSQPKTSVGWKEGIRKEEWERGKDGEGGREGIARKEEKWKIRVSYTYNSFV